jgi:hypothetical protein
MLALTAMVSVIAVSYRYPVLWRFMLAVASAQARAFDWRGAVSQLCLFRPVG